MKINRNKCPSLVRVWRVGVFMHGEREKKRKREREREREKARSLYSKDEE